MRLAGIEQIFDEDEILNIDEEKMQDFFNERSVKIPVIDAIIGDSDIWNEIADAIILHTKYKNSDKKLEIDGVIVELSTLTEIHLRRAENALRKLIVNKNWEK